MIALRFTLTSSAFLLLGFSLMMLMRWQLAEPGGAVPPRWRPPRPGQRTRRPNRSMPRSTVIPEFGYPNVGEATLWLSDGTSGET